MVMPLSFREALEAQVDRVTDKWDSYLAIYDRAFAAYRDREVSLLEIGIQNGGSLEVHARYFAHHKLIIGCDIDPRCGALSFLSNDKIKVVVGDANAAETRAKIASLSADIDIIIDDGSHKSNDIIRSFLYFFPKLKPGGIFVIEDLHASYWQTYDGGLFHPSSAMSLLKDLVDLPNLEHWGLAMTPQEYLATRHPQYAPVISACDLSGIHSVQFFNSVCIIEKHLTDPVASLGPRRIRGTRADVSPGPLQMDGTRSIPPDQSNSRWSRPG
jgi:SAM-dependent methyltransferase